MHLTFSELNPTRFQTFKNLSEDPANQFSNVRFMKYAAGLFGWFDRRLIQTEDDQDVVRRKLIESDFDFGLIDKDYFVWSALLICVALFIEMFCITCLSKS